MSLYAQGVIKSRLFQI